VFDPVWERTHRERRWGYYPKEELVRWVARNLRHQARTLDLGAGQGASTWFLAREGFSPVALDGSLSALTKARDRLDAEGLPYEGVAADLTQLPFVAGSFDAVVDVVASAHNPITHMAKIAAEIVRVLKPKGKLFSVLPTNRCSRRTFRGFVSTFLEQWEVEMLYGPLFENLQILRSSYELSHDCLIDNWILTAQRKE
jgi:ubiquinone/menaquinone biosynthesis C-methylase UbiE